MKTIALCIVFSLIATYSVEAQKQSLKNLLWDEVGGKINPNEEHGGRYEIVDDSKNGYLKVAFTEEGCGCYTETAVGAFKNSSGAYTTLQTKWDGCSWRKKLSSNKELHTILPENFGLQTFLPKSESTEYQITSSVFFLEAVIPQKGTDTKINLSYIPFGINMTPDDHVQSYGYELNEAHGGANYLYQEELQDMLRKISDENTLQCILEKTPESIISKDRKIVEKLYGEGKKYRGIEELALQIEQLKTIYAISKDIEYKSVILAWNRAEARFYIKEKIKNDAPGLSFLWFIKQLLFLTAIC
ncbi:hypothetical protein FEE95_06115 [Maribacter algarum]|uniref:Uncharacterized protein n=1 Tax=Maribacter algarum (ex Zhang et al. 2020) TaxID=2578118 RepID=A0A5S3PVG6_9FLAO|nr:hypothetical protein [Maribacter algarum]TMM59006.1 hypothetical protein FEE95_06115 [Maribacter algarum]